MGLLNEINNINTTLNKKERERAEKQMQKEFYNKLLKKAKGLLFDAIMQEIEKNLYCEIVYIDNTKNIIIDNVLERIVLLKYDLQDSTWENLNFYLDEIYYTIANKCISIYKKKEKALIYNKLYNETLKELTKKE